MLKPKKGISRPHNRQWFACQDFLDIVFTNYYWPFDQTLIPSPMQKKKNVWAARLHTMDL